MGPDKLIGISTHNPDQVREATAGNLDYLGFGPIFKPGSKQDHDPVVGLEGLRAMRSAHVVARLCDWWHSDRPGRGGDARRREWRCDHFSDPQGPGYQPAP